MSKGIFVALSGAVAQQTALEATASNVANASSAGYQRLRPVFRRALAAADRDATLVGASVARMALDGAPGAVRKTDRALDVALPQGAFLALATPRGERYTRSTSLVVAPNGALETRGGAPVMGASGEPIRAKSGGGALSIEPDGLVMQGGAPLDRLKVVRFEQPDALAPEGAGVLGPGGAGRAAPVDVPLAIGALEESNAQPVAEMTELMTATRTFDAFQKVLDTMSDVDRRLVTTVPNPGE